MPKKGIVLPPLTLVVAVPMLRCYPSSHVLKSSPAIIVALSVQKFTSCVRSEHLHLADRTHHNCSSSPEPYHPSIRPILCLILIPQAHRQFCKLPLLEFPFPSRILLSWWNAEPFSLPFCHDNPCDNPSCAAFLIFPSIALYAGPVVSHLMSPSLSEFRIHQRQPCPMDNGDAAEEGERSARMA